MSRKLTQAQKLAIIPDDVFKVMWLEHSRETLANELGVTPYLVSKRAKKQGLPPKRRDRWTPEEFAQRVAGCKDEAEAAKRLNLSVSQVSVLRRRFSSLPTHTRRRFTVSEFGFPPTYDEQYN